MTSLIDKLIIVVLSPTSPSQRQRLPKNLVPVKIAHGYERKKYVIENNWLHSQCYRQWLFKAHLCITLKIRIWVVAYFFNFFKLFQKKKIIKVIWWNFSMWMLKYFLKNFKIVFCPQKVEKTTLKSCSEFLKSTFFSLLPWLPKRPKQKNSCSKMWPID